MDRKVVVPVLVIAVCLVALLLRTSSDASESALLNVKLNDDMPAYGDVFEVLISPDSQWVVYTANVGNEYATELFLAPTTGDKSPIQLSGPTDVVMSFAWTQDSSHVVYLAKHEGDDQELYSVPINGGTAVKLNGPLVTGGEVRSFLISPDSSRVVYRADQETENTDELFSVPINGGMVVKLNGPLVSGGEVQGVYSIYPDSSRVLYRADQENDDVFELFTVPIEGGTVVKLTPPMVSGGDASSGIVSPDGSRVVYKADQETDNVIELYSLPVSGGTPVKLNPPVGEGDEIYDISISEDSSRVVYRLYSQANPYGTFELFSVPIDGGTAVKLTPSVVGGSSLERRYGYAISPDSNYVVYRAELPSGDDRELFSVPIGGGTITKLNPPLVSGGFVYFFIISPDSSRVVYIADQETEGLFELFSVPIGGGTAVKLNPPRPVGASDGLSEFEISPDSSRVIYQANQDNVEVFELFRVPINGGTTIKLNGPMVSGGNVSAFEPGFTSFFISPDSNRVVYLADQETNNVFELFATFDDSLLQPTSTSTPTHTATPTSTTTPVQTSTPTSTSTPLPEEWLAYLPVVLNPTSTNEKYAWQQVDSGTNRDLSDVDILSSNDGWVVGGNTFLHWDGTAWSQGSATTSGIYEGLGMVSSSDGWAVGLNGKIARWDGTSWKDFATHPDEVWLWDVDMLSASDGWIVGDDGTILRWNGSSWSSVPSPVDFRLLKVRAVSANEAWIAGFDFDTAIGVILHWDGTEWVKQTIPQTGRLFDIAMSSPSEAWAVGESGVVLHWDNGVWDEWRNPTSRRSQQYLWLMGIDMLSPTLGWFVGGDTDFTFIAKWDGTSWTSVENSFNSFLQAIDMVSPTDGWAVGYKGAILHYAPES